MFIIYVHLFCRVMGFPLRRVRVKAYIDTVSLKICPAFSYEDLLADADRIVNGLQDTKALRMQRLD